MGVQMTDFARRNSSLCNGDLHGSTPTIAILRGGGDMTGIGCRAIANEFGDWCYPARKRMAQCFNDDHSGPFAHDKSITRCIEWAGYLARRFVKADCKRPRRSKTTHADDVHAGFCSTADSDVGFVRKNEPFRISDRLDAEVSYVDLSVDRDFATA